MAAKTGTASTGRGLAKALGLDPKTARRWIKRGAPTREDGTYDVRAVAAWIEEQRLASVAKKKHGPIPTGGREEDDAPTPSMTGSKDEMGARTKLDYDRRRIAVAREAFRFKLERGGFVERDKVDALLVARATTFRSLLLVASRTFGQRHPEASADMVRTLEELHRDVLWTAYGRKATELPAPPEPPQALEDEVEQDE